MDVMATKPIPNPPEPQDAKLDSKPLLREHLVEAEASEVISEKIATNIDAKNRLVDSWLGNLKASYALGEILNYGRRKKPRIYWFIKRALDIVVVGSVISLISPLYIIIALAIRLDSKGPIFFSQERVGERLKLFNIFKFRTMYVGAESAPMSIYDEEKGEFRRPTIKEDPRVTRVGRVLRRWSLDELPQLFNILFGDMTLVGPRPLMSHEALDIPTEALVRYSVPVGLTGLAQIRNRNLIINTKRFDDDIEYVEKIGLRTDIKIILLTLPEIRQ